jgi:heme-degrading monooxygenase HmoA
LSGVNDKLKVEDRFMIRHIVMFKIKDEFKDEIPQLVKNFYGMKGRIEGMLELEAGADILHSERSYDLALVTLFENREAFDAYQTHPVHMPVKKRMHEVRSGSVACDFEV